MGLLLPGIVHETVSDICNGLFPIVFTIWDLTNPIAICANVLVAILRIQSLGTGALISIKQQRQLRTLAVAVIMVVLGTTGALALPLTRAAFRADINCQAWSGWYSWFRVIIFIVLDTVNTIGSVTVIYQAKHLIPVGTFKGSSKELQSNPPVCFDFRKEGMFLSFNRLVGTQTERPR